MLAGEGIKMVCVIDTGGDKTDPLSVVGLWIVAVS
jgi:hypothetical protein